MLENFDIENMPFLGKIRQITPIGLREVFDCSIPGPNCYSAAGILAHNG